jgi:hypothetical protein
MKHKTYKEYVERLERWAHYKALHQEWMSSTLKEILENLEADLKAEEESQ